MPRDALPRGLYVITDSRLLPPDQLVARVEQAILGGAVLVQYRDKSPNEAMRLEQAGALHTLCGDYGVPLLINDDAALARTIGAAGVHIGRQDLDLARARTILGPSAIIGVSCYNQLDRARQAVAAGADYVAFGRFFPSKTKPDAVQAPLDLLEQARAELDCPICTIGGITPENGGSLVEAGADLLAVIHGVFGESDVTAAAGRFAALFPRT